MSDRDLFCTISTNKIIVIPINRTGKHSLDVAGAEIFFQKEKNKFQSFPSFFFFLIYIVLIFVFLYSLEKYWSKEINYIKKHLITCNWNPW